jgi:predicted dithiol-disulfide oxidoreductase (DUF899 family)
MFDPEWDEGCNSCSFIVDNVGHLAHLHARNTSFALVSRAPLSKIQPFKARMDWTLPWYSSFESDFNYDFHVTQDEAVAPVEYNFRSATDVNEAGLNYVLLSREQWGLSVFLREGDRVFHTYSTYGRGVEGVISTYSCLDLTPLGRQEEATGTGPMSDFEEGRARLPGIAFFDYHDGRAPMPGHRYQ